MDAKPALDVIETSLNVLEERLDNVIVGSADIATVVAQHKGVAVSSVVAIVAGTVLIAGSSGYKLGERKSRLRYEKALAALVISKHEEADVEVVSEPDDVSHTITSMKPSRFGKA